MKDPTPHQQRVYDTHCGCGGTFKPWGCGCSYGCSTCNINWRCAGCHTLRTSLPRLDKKKKPAPNS